MSKPTTATTAENKKQNGNIGNDTIDRYLVNLFSLIVEKSSPFYEQILRINSFGEKISNSTVVGAMKLIHTKIDKWSKYLYVAGVEHDLAPVEFENYWCFVIYFWIVVFPVSYSPLHAPSPLSLSLFRFVFSLFRPSACELFPIFQH